MLDTKQLKAQGLRFGRSFQMALRTSVMFSPDHPSLTRPLEQSFEVLNELLKQTGQLTIGFVDNQVLINSVLTTDSGLVQLQKEFLKRGIAALTFEPGLTLARYRRIVAVLSAPSSAIEEAGGIREYLEAHEIPGARIVAASRNQKRNEEGDTLIESDSEAFILSKQMAEEGPRDFMESLDALLESACIDPASRTAALAALNPADPNLAGSGYGVPIAVPNLVIDPNSKPGTGWQQMPQGSGPAGEGSQVQPGGTGVMGGGGSGSGGGGTGSAGGGTGSSGGTGTGTGSGPAGYGGGFGGGSESFVGLAAGPMTGAPGFGGGSGGNSPGSGGNYIVNQPAGGGNSGGGYRTFMELVEDSVSRSLVEDNGNPRKSYLALARILKEGRLDTVLSHFPPEKREELRTLPPEQLAAEYIEENTLRIIAKQLKQAGDGKTDKYVIEEDVLRLLARSLQATHMADRLAFKLAKFFQDFSTPPHLQAKIQDELRWTALTTKQKLTRLMDTDRYDFTEFRRLMDLIKDLTAQREPEKVTKLVLHYFDFLDEEGVKVEAEELSRSIEIIRTAKLGREPETVTIIQRIGGVLMRDDLSELIHFQAANNLSILSQTASVFEAFDKVVLIAELLRQSLVRDPEHHQKCCITGLSRMLAPTSIERLIELYISNRNDATLTKTAATILRHSHPVGTEAVVKHLIEEKNANNRLALLRLMSQIGSSSLETVRKNLSDERWYVVRNMCNLLAELRDPALALHLGEPLKHKEVRVQQAALNALTKMRAEGRDSLIANALPDLAPVVLEPALDELLYMRSPATVPGLEKFLNAPQTSIVMARKALQVLNGVPGAAATAALERLAAGTTAPEVIRNLAAEMAKKRNATNPPALDGAGGSSVA